MEFEGTLIGLPIHLIRRLQSVQNATARLIFRFRRSDHITDALISLHWLRVLERIVFKVAVQTYRALHGDAPQYLRQFTPVADKDFGLPPRTICADCLLLDIVLSLSLALVFGTLFLPMSPQRLLCSLFENV